MAEGPAFLSGGAQVGPWLPGELWRVLGDPEDERDPCETHEEVVEESFLEVDDVVGVAASPPCGHPHRHHHHNQQQQQRYQLQRRETKRESNSGVRRTEAGAEPRVDRRDHPATEAGGQRDRVTGDTRGPVEAEGAVGCPDGRAGEGEDRAAVAEEHGDRTRDDPARGERPETVALAGPADGLAGAGGHRSLRGHPPREDAAPPPQQLLPGNALALGSKPFRCCECGKAFVQVGQLARHRRIHTGERPFACAECGRRFTQSAHLKQHARTHTGERPFACADCGKRFAQSCQLGAHRRSHTGEKPYACGDCGARFSGSSALRRHRRSSHTGERPFACAECGKRFARGWLLALHARTHTGERPYVCVECGHGFVHSSALAQHRRSHAGEKPFACDECGKRFTARQQLRCHGRVHTGERPFICGQCGRAFAQSAYLTKHMRTHARAAGAVAPAAKPPVPEAPAPRPSQSDGPQRGVGEPGDASV